MKSGQGCIYTCTLPGEVYQVQLLSSLPSVRSCDQPHSVRRGGCWIFSVRGFVFLFFHLSAGCCPKTGQSLAFIPTGYLIYRVNCAANVSQQVSLSLLSQKKYSLKGIVVKMILHQQTNMISFLLCGQGYQRAEFNGYRVQSNLITGACRMELDA